MNEFYLVWIVWEDRNEKMFFANLVLVILVSQIFDCGKNENSKEEQWLKEVQEYIDDENYQAAKDIYEEKLSEHNETAMINLWYLCAIILKAQIPTAIDAVRALPQDVGIPSKHDDLKEEDLDFLAESAYVDACCPGNPRDTCVEDLKMLFRNLM